MEWHPLTNGVVVKPGPSLCLSGSQDGTLHGYFTPDR